MGQKDMDIYEILKGVPAGTELYTPMCGKVEFRYLQDNKEEAEAIITNTNNGAEYTFNKNGKYVEEGEVLLFPSNEMRDWSKFFKKGDVLVSKKEGAHIIFEKFTDDTYTIFAGKYYYRKAGKKGYSYLRECNNASTECFAAETEDAAKTYISFIEERLDGKLNRETLEVEKPKKKPVFELGKLYVFNEEDEDGELTIIGKLIGKYESEDTLRFGNQYEIENEKFVTDQAFDLRISVHNELREATEDEVVKFQEACTLWEKSKEKKGKELPDFKPFDKVLVRNGEKCEWIPAFFVRDLGEGFSWRFNVLPIHSGHVGNFASCIPFEGHENIAFTDYDIENLPF